MSYLLNYRGWKKINEATIAVNKINGNMPDSALVKISVEPGDAQGAHKLNPQAASDYEKMRTAAKEEGIIWGITDSYRPYSVQDKIFDWDRFKKSGEAKKKGTNVAAAYPGTSNHGFGSAVDLNLFGPGVYGAQQSTPEAKANYEENYKWLQANANKYGFYELAGEPWHWDHKPSADRLKSSGEITTVSSEPLAVSASNYVAKLGDNNLIQKLQRFEQGDLIIDETTDSVEDIISLVKINLPKEYKKLLGEDLPGEFSEGLVNALKQLQKDKSLPVTGKIDVATYNEIFKNIV